MTVDELVRKLEALFLLQMLFEYPQIDEQTRKYLSNELAIIAAGEVINATR